MTRSRTLVLFDIDGTLLRGAGPHHKQALVAGIQVVTGCMTSLEGVPTAGMLDRDLIAVMLRAIGQTEEEIRSATEQIVAACQKAYLENCAADLTAFRCAGVLETLSTLKHLGAVMGLVTGNFSQIGWKKVELAGLRDYFELGAFSEDAHSRVGLARIAAERALESGLIEESSRISLIGDHPNDVEAAKSNHFQSVAVATGIVSIEHLRAAEPDILVRDLTELEVERLVG